MNTIHTGSVFYPTFANGDPAFARVFRRDGRFCNSLGYCGDGFAWEAEKAARCDYATIVQRYREDSRWVEEANAETCSTLVGMIDNRRDRRKFVS